MHQIPKKFIELASRKLHTMSPAKCKKYIFNTPNFQGFRSYNSIITRHMLNETIYKNHASGFEMHKNCHNLINHYGLDSVQQK